MSDRFKNELQETGKASTLGLSFQEVALDILELGIDAEDVVFSGSNVVVARTLPDDPEHVTQLAEGYRQRWDLAHRTVRRMSGISSAPERATILEAYYAELHALELQYRPRPLDSPGYRL